jgi:nitronate monooxygenase
MTVSTALTRLLGITHPILLAPMGGVSGGRLAGAVTEAGGLGIIGGGYGDPNAGYGGEAWMEEQFRAAGNARIGVGYITWSMARNPRLLDQALDRRPAAFVLSFGDERPWASKIKETGAKLICQVQDLDGAKRARDAGADVIVAKAPRPAVTGQRRARLWGSFQRWSMRSLPPPSLRRAALLTAGALPRR